MPKWVVFLWFPDKKQPNGSSPPKKKTSHTQKEHHTHGRLLFGYSEGPRAGFRMADKRDMQRSEASAPKNGNAVECPTNRLVALVLRTCSAARNKPLLHMTIPGVSCQPLQANNDQLIWPKSIRLILLLSLSNDGSHGRGQYLPQKQFEHPLVSFHLVWPFSTRSSGREVRIRVF